VSNPEDVGSYIRLFVSLLSLGAFDETSCLEILESCETKKPFPSRDLVRLDIFSLFLVWVSRHVLVLSRVSWYIVETIVSQV
jgi:hypothetical protein